MPQPALASATQTFCADPPPQVDQWCSVRNLNLSYCGLTTLPASIGQLRALRILRLSHNKLGALPLELGSLTSLEVLAADHNQLTAVPGGRVRLWGQ